MEFIMKHNTVHTKPFCLEHAKAGAPYCQRNGQPARIGIWDGKGEDVKLIGVLTENNGYEYAAVWDTTGRPLTHNNGATLVMLPLGYCEDKPVFVGDELINEGGRLYTVAPETLVRESYKWPRIAPVMPECRDVKPNYGYLASEVTSRLLNFQREEIEAYWKALDEFNGVKK